MNSFVSNEMEIDTYKLYQGIGIASYSQSWGIIGEYLLARNYNKFLKGGEYFQGTSGKL